MPEPEYPVFERMHNIAPPCTHRVTREDRVRAALRLAFVVLGWGLILAALAIVIGGFIGGLK